jgi:HPt (histidine-containing phosphotransfer) domain-containing protein
MESAAKTPLSEALNQLWVKFLPQMEERLAAVDAANRALAVGGLADEERAAAAAAAHKLAGVLGTFGLADGTQLAREAEEIFTRNDECGRAARLVEIAGRLRDVIASRR